jgi:hypothetical protein
LLPSLKKRITKNGQGQEETAMQAYYNGEEIKVRFIADSVRTDFGVPGSPVWEEVDMNTVEVSELHILDMPFLMKDLPEALQDAILSLWNEVEFY